MAHRWSRAAHPTAVMVDDQTQLVYVLHNELCTLDDIREAARIHKNTDVANGAASRL